MTYEQYWNDKPELVIPYRKAHELRMKQRNQELWMQGLYIYNAFGVVLSNAFSKKGAKQQHYFEEPIPIFGKTEEEKQRDEQREFEKIDRQLHAMYQKQQAMKALKENAEGNLDDGNNS